MKKRLFNNYSSRFALLKRIWVIKLLLLCLITIPANANAFTDDLNSTIPQQSVSGVVSDANGPIPGVNVQVKGTSTGAVTDFDGNYTIKASASDVLILSYIGYVTKEVVVGNNTTLNITLEEDAGQLDEVIVIGYGTKTKGELTGSVSTVSGEDIERTQNSNLSKSLAGTAPGLTVLDRGGYPGDTGEGGGQDDAVQILIRGASTLGNNSPLIVVDGVPTNSFSFLAPSDIASFSILKDGAAAIYGARAANGVILITTNRGKQGKTEFNASIVTAFSQFTRVPKYMNSWQYATYKNEFDTRRGVAPIDLSFTDDDIAKYRAGNDPINYPDTDWYDLTMQDWASEKRYNVSASGGTENVKYFFSGNAMDQGGQFASGTLNFKQYQVRSNLDVKVTETIKFGADIYANIAKRRQPGSNIQRIYKHLTVNLPIAVGRYPNGLYGVGAENGNNPALMASGASGFNNTDSSELRTRFTGSIDLKSITDGLSIDGSATFTLRNSDRKEFHNTWETHRYNAITDDYDLIPGYDFTTGNFLDVQDYFNKYSEDFFNAKINYRRSFNEHSVSAFAGFEQVEWRTKFFQAYRRDLVGPQHPELFAGAIDGQTSDGASQKRARLSYFGSISYDFAKKYLIDFTLRKDGSDIFAPGKKFGTFPAISAGWVVSSEEFMEGSNWLDFLKLRASWAEVGNDRVDPFQYLTRYQYAGNVNGGQYSRDYVFGENPGLQSAFLSPRVANPNATWESAIMKNIGVTFAMLDNKITGDFNVFEQTRDNILAQRVSVPDYSGFLGNSSSQLPTENFGKVKSSGFELEMNYANSAGEFNYNFGFNYTLAKSEVIFLDEAASVSDWQKVEGKPLGSTLVYPTAGIFRDPAQVANTTVTRGDAQPGDPIFLDTSGNGSIGPEDRIRTNTTPIPEIVYGIMGGLQYKNWDFNFLFQGQAKAEIQILFDNEGSRPQFLFEDRWTPDNTGARYPAAYGVGDAAAEESDLWQHDASFLRLKNVQLAYTIPTEVTKFADVKLYVNGTNLFTLSKIKDLDPETRRYRGITEGRYGPLRTVSFGANFKF